MSKQPTGWQVTADRTFHSHLSSLVAIRGFIAAQAATDGLDRAAADDLVLATNEAAANAILHAAGRTVRVTWSVEGGCVAIHVQDEGVFRRRLNPPGEDGGRGVHLMIALVDEIAIHEGTLAHPGTGVRLVKCVGSTDLAHGEA